MFANYQLRKADTLCFQYGEYDKAENIYKRYLLQPGNRTAIGRLANLARFHKNYKEALDYINLSLNAFDKEDPYLLYTKVRVLAEMKKKSSASKLFDQIHYTGENFRIRQQRAAAAIDVKKYSSAIYDCDLLLDKNKNDSSVLYTKAIALFNTKNYLNAIDFFTRSIAKRPSHSVSYYFRGLCYFYRKNYRLAFQDFSYARRFNPNLKKINTLRKNAFKKLGRKQCLTD